MRLMQAQRSADDAERQARSLQADVQIARSEATRAQQQARALEGQLDQADSRAGRARQNVESVKSQSAVSSASTMERQLTTGLMTDIKPPDPEPVVNMQGQITGRIINATA